VIVARRYPAPLFVAESQPDLRRRPGVNSIHPVQALYAPVYFAWRCRWARHDGICIPVVRKLVVRTIAFHIIAFHIIAVAAMPICANLCEMQSNFIRQINYNNLAIYCNHFMV
jgi:hypothetical protein